jgi:hypothetical protein
LNKVRLGIAKQKKKAQRQREAYMEKLRVAERRNKRASQREEPRYAMKGDKADLHRDTKTGLSKVSEDHPGTLGVAKSVKKGMRLSSASD